MRGPYRVLRRGIPIVTPQLTAPHGARGIRVNIRPILTFGRREVHLFFDATRSTNRRQLTVKKYTRYKLRLIFFRMEKKILPPPPVLDMSIAYRFLFWFFICRHCISACFLQHGQYAFCWRTSNAVAKKLKTKSFGLLIQ